MLLDLRGFWPVRRLGHLRGGAPQPAHRPVTTWNDRFGESAHSFLAGAVGSMTWYGHYDFNYMGFSNVTDRWNANGADRTGSYDSALVMALFGSFDYGTFRPDTPEGIEELQYLYWYALTAQAKGCAFMVLYPPHTPETFPAAWDPETMATTVAKMNWLNARPDLTIRSYVAPVPVLVRRLRAYYAPTPVFHDGLHLSDDSETMLASRAMGLMVYSMLTGQKYDGPLWPAGGGNAALEADMSDLAWAVVRDYACTGFGGGTVVAPWPMAGDPLPNPAPMPVA